MLQLLGLICEKRNLDVGDYRFDLPATEDSLAGKTLEQLKITSIRVVMRGKRSTLNRRNMCRKNFV
jgi:hypothetical protein